MKKKFLTGLSLLLLICTLLPMLAACSCNGDGPDNPDNNKGTISNEDTPLALASEALDGVFNPFYYTSGADGSVIGLTQIGMLTTDKDGNITCGKDTDSVALNYSYITTGTAADYESSGTYDNYYTTYYFAIKKSSASKIWKKRIMMMKNMRKKKVPDQAVHVVTRNIHYGSVPY